MVSELSVVVYTHDNSLFDLLRGLVGIQGSVLLAEEGHILIGHLVCIDLSFPHRNLVLDNLNDYERDFVLSVISANPFAVSQVRDYNIDAFLAKPLNGESVQALLVGAKARLAQKGIYG